MSNTKEFNLYDYKDENNNNEFEKWTKKLQKVEIAKLNLRLDMLKHKGLELFPGILTGTPTAGILKLRIKGKTQLRPMLCKGPIDKDNEFTLLIGAIERGSKFIPSKADETANARKNKIIKNTTQRCNHARVN